MYKVIVVGTDGSHRAGIAVKEAMALAKVSGAGLHAGQFGPSGCRGRIHRLASRTGKVNIPREEAEKITAQLLAEAEGVSLKVHNPGGEPARQRTSLRILSSSATA